MCGYCCGSTPVEKRGEGHKNCSVECTNQPRRRPAAAPAEDAPKFHDARWWQRVQCWCLNRADGRRHDFLPGRGVGLCGQEATPAAPVQPDALAEAWDQGYTAGHSIAMRRMSDEPNAPTQRNPYREPWSGEDR